MEDSNDKIEKDKDIIQQIEEVLKNNNIEEYIILFNDENEKTNIMYRPNDIVKHTRTLKEVHGRFYGELMSRIGES